MHENLIVNINCSCSTWITLLEVIFCWRFFLIIFCKGFWASELNFVNFFKCGCYRVILKLVINFDEDLTFLLHEFCLILVFFRLILYGLGFLFLFFYRVLCWISNSGFDYFMNFCLINARIKCNLIGSTKTW